MWGYLSPITCFFTSWELLYWTMKETNHSRRYSRGDLLKYGAQMLIKESISRLKKAPSLFLQFVMSCLHYQRSGAFLNKLCFVMSSVLPSSVSDSKQTDFLPTQCRRTTPDFVKLFWFWFSLLHYKNHLIAWEKKTVNRIDMSCRSQYKLHDYSLSV